MINLLILYLFRIPQWFFEAKSDLEGNKEKFYDSIFIGLGMIFISVLFYLITGSILTALFLLVIDFFIHWVFHDGFINLIRGRGFYAHFTVDDDKDWGDKIHAWFYKRGLNLAIIVTVILILLDVAFIYYIKRG